MELTRLLKAVPMLATGSFGFSSHALISRTGSVHVNGDDEIGEWCSREDCKEQPKNRRHVVWIDHGLVVC